MLSLLLSEPPWGGEDPTVAENGALILETLQQILVKHQDSGLHLR
jgi:hypothetical protein